MIRSEKDHVPPVGGEIAALLVDRAGQPLPGAETVVAPVPEQGCHLPARSAAKHHAHRRAAGQDRMQPGRNGAAHRHALPIALDSPAILAEERAMSKRGGRNGHAIAAGHRLTAEAAEAMLGEGGTAADAAVAAALTAMVAEPVLAGLLGGGFAMVRSPSTVETRLIDFLRRYAGALPARGRDRLPRDRGRFRPDAPGIPYRRRVHRGPAGLSRGLWQLHERFGRMPMRRGRRAGASPLRGRGCAITAYPGAACAPSSRRS